MQAERPALKRFVADPLFALVTALLYGLFRLLPLGLASAIGGGVGRAIGPHLAVSRRARHNLTRAFPEKSAAEINAIERGMWDNLGRIVGEYPHVPRINVYDPDGPVEVVGIEHVDAMRDDGKPGIFISAHLANWELVSLGGLQRGVPLDRIYRAANNRLVEWLYRRGRQPDVGDGDSDSDNEAIAEGEMIPKGPAGARKLLAALKAGRHLGIMADQKMNDGIAVPFFGRDAMTAPALAELALRFDCPVVPARVERLGGARFRLIVEPPLDFTPSGERHADVAAMMAMVNQRIEDWVRATPEQWLWLHNRWPD